MNNPPTTMDYLILGVLLALGMIFLYIFIWFNFLRKKKQASSLEREADEDMAFNALYQTKSIVRMFRQKGNDTSRSEKIIEEAERELDKKHYTTVIALANSAKSLARGIEGTDNRISKQTSKEFITAKESAVKFRPRVSMKRPVKKPLELQALPREEVDQEKSSVAKGSAIEFAYYKPGKVEPLLDKTDEILMSERTTLADEALPSESDSFTFRKKLPENYMESKFKLELAEQAIADAKNAGKSTDHAEEFLLQARSAFDSKDYALALSTAIKAEKTVQGKPIEPVLKTPGRPPEIITDAATPVPEPAMQAAAVSAAPVRITEVTSRPPILIAPTQQKIHCTKCGREVALDDNFCRKCGVKVEKPLNCPACTIKLEKEDVFCRKCGIKVDHITQQ